MDHEARIRKLQLELPPPPEPLGAYRPLVIVANLAYVSGHVPLAPDGSMIRGRVGADLDQAAGYQVARQVGLAMLATLRAGLGSLDRVHRLVKTTGMVNCLPEFDALPAVINGFSELMADVFGQQAGVGARSVAGMASLPANIPVEIDAVFEIGAAAND